MNWVAKASTYRAERNGKLLGYIQKDRAANLYKWTCSAFASRAESKSSGSHYTLEGAKQAFEDFWNLSLKHYGLSEDFSIKDKHKSFDNFSDGDAGDLNEIFGKV